MAVSNTIMKQQNTQTTAVTEYEANGEVVRISPDMIKKYLVNGGGKVTDEEVMMFLSLCKFNHLNPWLREAYLIKYGDTQPATMVVGKDVFMKRARRQADFDGIEAGIIVRNKETKAVEYRDGTFWDKSIEDLAGGWAKVYIKNFHVPVYSAVSIGEYVGRKKNGEVNQQWMGKPATMIRKVALMQALREAYPEQNSGMYVQEEIKEAQDVVLNDEAVVVEEAQEVQANAEKIPTQASAENVADTFFD